MICVQFLRNCLVKPSFQPNCETVFSISKECFAVDFHNNNETEELLTLARCTNFSRSLFYSIVTCDSLNFNCISRKRKQKKYFFRFLAFYSIKQKSNQLLVVSKRIFINNFKWDVKNYKSFTKFFV